MLNTIKHLLGFANKIDYKKLVNENAIILDVRTRGEFHGGHIKGSMNIPLDTLNNNLNKLKKSQTIITCCASGIRSASAKEFLNPKDLKKSIMAVHGIVAK